MKNTTKLPKNHHFKHKSTKSKNPSNNEMCRDFTQLGGLWGYSLWCST